jgi:hypothetical protein
MWRQTQDTACASRSILAALGGRIGKEEIAKVAAPEAGAIHQVYRRLVGTTGATTARPN